MSEILTPEWMGLRSCPKILSNLRVSANLCRINLYASLIL